MERPAHLDELVWLPAVGGPLDGERIPYPGAGRMSPERGHRLELADPESEALVAVYVWCPIREAFVCRYEEAA